jgi:predicted CopG family antitoxin
MFGTKKIAIEKSLWERIEKVAEAAGYASVEDFVRHLIEREVRHLEEAKDEAEVKKRLEGLGYL